MRIKKGFTLAEVLITLGIIGVVAAMTIPILVNNYQKTQYVTQLKKAYVTFNNALSLLTIDAGCPNDLSCLQVSDETDFMNQLIKHLKVIKVCNFSFDMETMEEHSDSGCMPEKVSTAFDGSIDGGSLDGMPRFITADGASYRIESYYTPMDFSRNVTGDLKQTYGQVIIDVNGPQKGPNFYGRDIFLFFIANGKRAILYPRGGGDVKFESNLWKNSCTSETKVGTFCAGRIMEEGWQMNY